MLKSTWLKRYGLYVCVTVSLLITASLKAAPAAISWDSFVAEFLEHYFVFEPTSAVAEGRHEFDGKLPDWSESGLNKYTTWLKEERIQANAFSQNELSSKQRFERDYLVMEIRKELFWLETADEPHTNPMYYSGSIDPDVYVSRPYASLETRLRAYIAYTHSLPAAIAQLEANLDRPLAKTYAEIGKQTIGGLADYFKTDVPAVFAAVNNPELQAEFKVANASAIKAVTQAGLFFAKKAETKEDNFALGAEKFRAMVRETEGVDLPLDQLEAIGQKDLERNLKAMREACALYAPDLSVYDAAKKAIATKPPGSVTEYATQQLVELRKFITDHDLVSIPGTEQALVHAAPAYKAWNSAYIEIPGPYEVGLPSVYYVSPPDPSWSKQKQLDYIPGVSVLLFTSSHEVYPGHFVQFLHANRSESKFGQIFVGYAFAEGWAHYSEEMMWEAGLGNQSPALHIGQLEEALLRDVRFISAIGLHTKGMTIEQSKHLFLTQGFQDEGDADQQARRGAFDPAYLNYTLGKLMIRKLRADWTSTRGGRSAWKLFHDQFLSYGGPPIPLVRKAMMGPSDSGSLF